MKTSKKICLGFLACAASLSALYFGVLYSLPNLIDLNKYKQTFSSEIEKQTGFKFSCEDIKFERTFSPYLKVNMHHTLVLYPDNEVFLKLKDAELKIKIFPLILKNIVVKDAKLTRPIINMTLYKDFSTSLEKYIKPEKVINTNGFKFNALVYDTVCERYKLKIKDESIDKLFYLEGDELLIKDIKLNENAHVILKGSLFEGEKKYLTYDIDVNSSLKNKAKQFTFSPFKPIYEYDVKGDIRGVLGLSKESLLKGFLNINDLSLNIDNTILNNNSAKLIFKGQEVEIDSTLHTSKTDEAKVKGIFNYGKKKYIDIDAKAKNVNLQNLVKIISVITESLNIKNPLSDINVKGIANAEFTLNSDFRKLKSSGEAKIINAEIMHKLLPYKITKINSLVNFKDNKINIENTQAFINSTPVSLSGVINEDVTVDIQAVSDNLDLKTIVELFIPNDKLPIKISSGNLSFKSNITGSLNNLLQAQTDVNINDLKFIHKKMNLPVNIASIVLDIKNNSKGFSGSAKCADIKALFNNNPITAKTVDILFTPTTIKVSEETDINVLTSPFKFKANISNYMENPVGQIDFAGDIYSNNLAKLLSEYVKQPYSAVGKLKTTGNISILKDVIKVKSKINSDKDNYLSYLVIKELLNKPSFTNVDVDFNKDNILVRDISLNENLDNKTEPVVSVFGNVLNDKEFLLDNLRIKVPNPISISTNFMGGEDLSFSSDILLNKTIKQPEISGSAKIQKYNIKKFYTAIKNADVNFSKNNIKIIAPDVQINTSKFNLMADVEPKFSEVINVSNLQINSLNLDLNTLFAMIEKETSPFASTVLNIENGSATINNFRILDIKARDISTDFSVKNNILKLDNISASAYNGIISGLVSYDMNHSQLDVKLIGKGLDVKDTLYDLCKIEDNLAGKMDFTSSVSMLSGEYEQVMKSLNGNITFDAYKGRMGTLGKFHYYLYAQNLFYHGILNATLNRLADALSKDNTSDFVDAKGSLNYKDGFMTINEIKTVGKNMSLYMKGRQNLLNNQANIDIYGRISDDVKSKLGSFGDVSISELVSGKSTKKNVSVMSLPNSVMSNIPELDNYTGNKTNTFKVNIYGNINSVGSINSFVWTVPKEDEVQKLPEFSEL